MPEEPNIAKRINDYLLKNAPPMVLFTKSMENKLLANFPKAKDLNSLEPVAHLFTPYATLADRLAETMAEPIEETRRKAIEVCQHYGGQTTNLFAQLKYERSMARLWHIETGRPLPPFSNGNYDADKTIKSRSGRRITAPLDSPIGH